MSLKAFLALIIFGTIFAWLALGMAIFSFDPEKIGVLGFGVFYLSLFLSLSGIMFIIFDYFKAKIFKNQLLYLRLRNSVRHAILFSILVIGWGFLRSQELLTWWNIILFIVILTVLEFFFISTQKRKNIYAGQNSTTQESV